MQKPVIKFKRLSQDAIQPFKAHPSDSGLDIRSTEDFTLVTGATHTFSTGIAFVIPDGYEIQVRPRSGLSSKGIVAAWGTVDAGYRGEIGITITNVSDTDFKIFKGSRIAQLVIAKVQEFALEETDDLGEQTDRGGNGFGSTGI